MLLREGRTYDHVFHPRSIPVVVPSISRQRRHCHSMLQFGRSHREGLEKARHCAWCFECERRRELFRDLGIPTTFVDRCIYNLATCKDHWSLTAYVTKTFYQEIPSYLLEIPTASSEDLRQFGCRLGDFWLFLIGSLTSDSTLWYAVEVLWRLDNLWTGRVVPAVMIGTERFPWYRIE